MRKSIFTFIMIMIVSAFISSCEYKSNHSDEQVVATSLVCDSIMSDSIVTDSITNDSICSDTISLDSVTIK